MQEATDRAKMYPACLPTRPRSSKEGLHSGWAKPIPRPFLEKYAPGYLKVFGDFYKQTQFKMDVHEKCADPKVNSFGFPLNPPTNTFYPSGKAIVHSIHYTKTI